MAAWVSQAVVFHKWTPIQVLTGLLLNSVSSFNAF